MKVKITNGHGWYEEQEGNIFEVVERNSRYDGHLIYAIKEDVINSESFRFIRFNDCQIISESDTQSLELIELRAQVTRLEAEREAAAIYINTLEGLVDHGYILYGQHEYQQARAAREEQGR